MCFPSHILPLQSHLSLPFFDPFPSPYVPSIVP
jgi:hypothetical protein